MNPSSPTRRTVLVGLSLLLCAALLSACGRRPCGDSDAACLERLQKAHPVGHVEFWRDALGKPVTQRFGPAPAPLAEYLELDNRRNGFHAHPQPAAPSADFMRDVATAIATMPDAVRRLIGPRLAGVYFVTDLGSTGFTDKILDEHDQPVAAYVVLDYDALSARLANEWASWKENTPFRPADGYRLNAIIESPENDTRANAIQYILLHEFGHVLAVDSRFHPAWWNEQAVKDPAAYPFFALSWQVDSKGQDYEPRREDDFAARSKVVYYHAAKLEAQQMPAVYTDLGKTNFPTLYATTNPFDDFAESFANYVHVVLMHKPFEIDIGIHGMSALSYTACWDTPRCAQKQALLEKTLAAS